MTTQDDADTTFDSIIVGQGLAGTTLAWQLQDAGQRVLVLDAEAPVSSSKIAAGLITPITGLRLALSWRIHEFLPAARDFYTRIEARTGARFFHDRRSVRLFSSDRERQQWPQRLCEPELRSFVVMPGTMPLLAPEIGDDSGGGFEMRAAQLDVARYLAASRTAFPYAGVTLDWSRDVTFAADAVRVLGWRCQRIISCEGFAASRNPYLGVLRFNAAKGDILTVRFARALPPDCLHRGLWVAPTPEPDVFRVGATYDLRTLDNEPSETARADIEARLMAFVRVPYTVIDHQASVRPIVHLSEAVMGLHPEMPQLGYFNGLGSKGSLHAPWYAAQFADFLARGVALPDSAQSRARG